MRALHYPYGGVWWGRQIRDPQIMVALVAAVCLFVEASLRDVAAGDGEGAAGDARGDVAD